MAFNKEKVKGIFIGIILTLIGLLPINLLFAQVATKSISVIFNDIKVYVNNSMITSKDSTGNIAEPFIYNGVTYLPLNTVADVLGKIVTFDGKTNSVYIGKHDSNTPVAYLYDLDYFNKSYMMNKAEVQQDNLGNTYTGVVYGGFYKSNWAEYAIQGKYSKLKGKAIVGYNSRSKKTKGVLKIYGDDILKYTSPVMTAGTYPQEFEVDLTGVTKLKVEFLYDTGDPNFGIVETGLYQ